MTISKLTTKTPDPTTGLTKTFLGFRFSSTTLQDAFQGIGMAYSSPAAGWTFNLSPDQSSPPPGNGAAPIWKVTLSKPNGGSVVVVNPDWIAFDGQAPFRLAEADVEANYVVTNWTPPNALP